MRLFKTASILSAILLMAGCASNIDGATQNVRIDTPGATEAECHLINGVKYRAVTGETLRIMRSHRDLVVDCYASGNRHKQIVVESSFNDWGYANVTNGVVPGVAYDHFSGGLYTYPPIITVDFVGIPTPGYETPSYHNKDLPNPYKQSIEDMGANTPAIPQDSVYLKRGLEKRETVLDSNPFSSGPSAEASSSSGSGSSYTGSDAPYNNGGSGPKYTGKNAEELNRSANPSVFK